MSHSVAEAWQRGVAARTGVLGPVTERMLDLAGVEAGSRVLDIAAGTGEQTLMAARRVGQDGFVLAVDIAPEMLQVAADEARTAGLVNVEILVADALALDLNADSFDAAICRRRVSDRRGHIGASRPAFVRPVRRPRSHTARTLEWALSEDCTYRPLRGLLL